MNVGASARRLAALALAAALLAGAGGCGRRFLEPKQSPKAPYIPPPETFILVAGWTQPAWQPTCVLLTHSGILLVAEDSARVRNYSSLGQRGQITPIDIYRFNGLTKPVQVAEGNSHVFVADMGDGSKQHPISVMEYDPSQGLDTPMDPVHVVVDTTWVRIKGVASDLQRNLYVSCDARMYIFQPPNLPALDTETVVYRYRAPNYDTALRDTVAQQGNGVGSLQDAHQIVWSAGVLYVADTGKDAAQALDPNRMNFGFFKVDGTEPGGPGACKRPQGVAADGVNDFYVVDTGNRRVLRYNLDGTFDQVVNQFGPDGMLAPTSATAGLVQSSLYLYVADPAAQRINVYRFQQ
ncbi:MAG TPA: hypothetical protein VMS93_14080 [Candidatus Saccharimonadales bacterium]|nr:hypothetical protein [Candidatus Saccharimonadales bacterium]